MELCPGNIQGYMPETAFACQKKSLRRKILQSRLNPFPNDFGCLNIIDALINDA